MLFAKPGHPTTASNRLAGQLPLGLILQLKVVLRSALRQGGNNMSGVHSCKYAIIQAIMGLPQRENRHITLQAADAGCYIAKT